MADVVRFKCGCGNVFDAPIDTPACTKCGAPLVKDGMGELQLYRMGNPLGVAVGFGIYIDGQPYGHVANAQKVRLLVPYGTHTVHCTHGMSRKGVDVTVSLSPENPVAYTKAHINREFLRTPL